MLLEAFKHLFMVARFDAIAIVLDTNNKITPFRLRCNPHLSPAGIAKLYRIGSEGSGIMTGNPTL